MGISNNPPHTLAFSTSINFTGNNNIFNNAPTRSFPADKATNRYFVATSALVIRRINLYIFQVQLFDFTTTIYANETEILGDTIFLYFRFY